VGAGHWPVAGGSCRRITLLRLRRLRLRTCPPPPARASSLPGRAPARASRSASVYSFATSAPAPNRCATAFRRRTAPPWSASALASQRVRWCLFGTATGNPGRYSLTASVRCHLHAGAGASDRFAALSLCHRSRREPTAPQDSCCSSRARVSAASVETPACQRSGGAWARGAHRALLRLVPCGPLARSARDACELGA
jgi:hypothetical protein